MEIPAATVGYLLANCFHCFPGILYQMGLGSFCEFTGLFRAGMDFQRLTVTSEKVAVPPRLWTLLRLPSCPLVLDETELDLCLKTTRSSEGLFRALFLFLITKLLWVQSGEGVWLPCWQFLQLSPERVIPLVLGLGLGLGGLIPPYPLLTLVGWLSSFRFPLVFCISLFKASRKASHFRIIALVNLRCLRPMQYHFCSRSDLVMERGSEVLLRFLGTCSGTTSYFFLFLPPGLWVGLNLLMYLGRVTMGPLTVLKNRRASLFFLSPAGWAWL